MHFKTSGSWADKTPIESLSAGRVPIFKSFVENAFMLCHTGTFLFVCLFYMEMDATS